MKKIYLLLVFSIATSSMGLTQFSDGGQLITPTKVNKSRNIGNQKAGEPLGEFCGYSIHSSPTGGVVSNKGIMFDITASATLFVSGISIQLVSGYSGKIVIYRRSGTHVGFENSSAGWIAIDSVNVTDLGGLTYIPIESGPQTFSGSTSAFYIRGDATNSVAYAYGTAVGNTIASNSDLTIKSGTSKSGIFGTSNSARDFKGILHYCKNTTVVCDTMQTAYNDNNFNKGVFFEVETVGQSVTVNQIFADFADPEGTKQLVDVWTRPSSYIGFESSSIGWTLLSSDTIVSPLPNMPEAVSSGISVAIPANSVQSFYLTSEGNGFSYTNGVTLGDIVVNDPVLKLKAGKGCNGNFSNILYSPRIFNGTIDYCITSAVGVDEKGLKTFKAYPNPASNEISIDFGENTVSNVLVVNTYGQIVLSQKANSEGVLSIDISNLANGTYFIKSETDTNFRVEKFVKL